MCRWPIPVLWKRKPSLHRVTMSRFIRNTVSSMTQIPSRRMDLPRPPDSRVVPTGRFVRRRGPAIPRVRLKHERERSGYEEYLHMDMHMLMFLVHGLAQGSGSEGCVVLEHLSEGLPNSGVGGCPGRLSRTHANWTGGESVGCRDHRIRVRRGRKADKWCASAGREERGLLRWSPY